MGILIDTSVFIGWWDRKSPYVHLMEVVENELFYIVICSELYAEYLRQIGRLYSGSPRTALEHALQGIKTMIREAEPRRDSLILMNAKDQIHMDCAHNEEYPAHLLVSEDRHFRDVKDRCPLPVILTFSEFMCDNMRTSACGDAKAVCGRVKQYGIREVFGSS